MEKSLDGVPVMPHESTESADLGIGFRHGKLLNCMFIVPTGADPLSQDMVGKVHNF